MDEGAAAALERWRLERDPVGKEACFGAWLPLVKRVWSRLKVGLPPSADALADDLLQCGAMGLLAAVESWDAGRNVPFEAWARLKIRGAMLDELRRQDTLSKEGRRRWKALRKAAEELEQRFLRPCTEEELAGHLGLGLEDLRRELQENAAAAVVFLDGLGGDEGLPLLERLADPAAGSAERDALAGERREALALAIGRLPPQERRLLVLLLEEDLGHKEAALVLGVSPGRVSQIYAKAILHLQAALASRFGG